MRKFLFQRAQVLHQGERIRHGNRRWWYKTKRCPLLAQCQHPHPAVTIPSRSGMKYAALLCLKHSQCEQNLKEAYCEVLRNSYEAHANGNLSKPCKPVWKFGWIFTGRQKAHPQHKDWTIAKFQILASELGGTGASKKDTRIFSHKQNSILVTSLILETELLWLKLSKNSTQADIWHGKICLNWTRAKVTK